MFRYELLDWIDVTKLDINNLLKNRNMLRFLDKNIDKLFVLALFKQKEKFLRGFFKKRIEHLK